MVSTSQLFGGVGTVEANLSVNNATNRVHLEDIRRGEWVMLSRVGIGSLPDEYKWYRIVSVEDEIQEDTPGTFTRWVTLAGADWETNSAINPNLTFVSLFEGAVAVFEKTMRVEGATLY